MFDCVSNAKIESPLRQAGSTRSLELDTNCKVVLKAEPKTASRGWPKMIWFAWILLMACAVWSIVRIVFAALDPLSYDYGEALVVANAHRLQTDWSLPNFYHLNTAFYNAPYQVYPPVYTYLLLLISRLLSWLPHTTPDQLIWPELYAGRFISLISTAVTMILIWLLVRGTGKNNATATACAAIFICFHPIYYYASFARVDQLATALSLGGLYLVFKYGKSSGYIVYLAILLFTIAFFTKQSEVGGAGASFLYFLVQKNWRRGLIFGGLLLSLNLTILGLVEVASNGEYLFHVLIQRFFPVVLNSLTTYSSIVFGVYLVVWVGAALGLYKTGFTQPLLTIWGGLSLLLALSVAKVGSDTYYFQEAIAFGCVMIGSFDGAKILKEPFASDQEVKKFNLGFTLRYAAVVALPIVQLLIFWLLQAQLIGPVDFRAVQRPGYKGAAQVIQSAGKDAKILTTSPDLLLMADRTDQSWDSFVFRFGAKAGYWNWQLLENDITQQQYTYLIFSNPIEVQTESTPTVPDPWPVGFARTVQTAYHLTQTFYRADGEALFYFYEKRN